MPTCSSWLRRWARTSVFTGADHCLLILPLFHVNAICVSVLTPLLVGGQVSVTGKFSVSRFFDDVARLRPTYFSRCRQSTRC